ncbi:MAG: serine protease [Solirubrobacteraceae bacterium]
MNPTRCHLSLILVASLAASLLVAVSTAGAQSATTRIVGGSVAQSWPAQGYLRAGDKACGGSLVSGRWFLTAGHCATDGSTVRPATAFQITLGRPDLRVAVGESHRVDQVIRHERYSQGAGSSDYDLALLHISSPTAPPQEPLSIVSPGEPGLWAAGTTATVIGWGTTCSKDCSVSLQLLQATVPVVSDAGCGGAYGAPFRSETMLCAGNGAADTCQGDSGGPLMVARQGEFVLAGVTSWGADCADPQHPGVFARVGGPGLNQWIRDRIPTAAIAIAPAAPQSRDAVALSATATKPASQSGDPSFSWDLDDDGAYDDAAGPAVSLPPLPAGNHVVRVQEAYPDGDRALAREVVSVAASPPPPPPPPPPPAAPVSPPKAKPLARLLGVPSRLSVRGLLDRRTSVRVRCYAACNLKATLRLDGRTARRLRLTRATASVQIGAGRARFAKARTARVTITITKRALRRLRSARSGSLALRVTATSGSRRTQLDDRLGLRR